MDARDNNSAGRSMVVRNEFSEVSVTLDASSGGALLIVRDLRTRNALWLDPIELEALTRLTREQLDELVNPAAAFLLREEEQ